MYSPDTEVPLSLEELDRTISAFESVEQLFRYLNPNTWKQDLDSIYTQTHLHYRSRAYHLAGRYTKGRAFTKHTCSSAMQQSHQDKIILVMRIRWSRFLPVSDQYMTMATWTQILKMFQTKTSPNDDISCVKGHKVGFQQD